jgi:hypothetical protein
VRELLDLYAQPFSPDWPAPNLLTFAILMIGCWIYALVRGGSPERIGSSIFVAGSLISLTTQVPFRTLEVGFLAIDILWLTAFLTLALKADRFWPLWIAAFQFITVAGHVVKIVDPDITGRTYHFMIVIWSYPMILLMIIGTWRHQRRLAHFGSDRSWSRRAMAV